MGNAKGQQPCYHNIFLFSQALFIFLPALLYKGMVRKAVSIYIRKPRFAGQNGKFTLFVVYVETGNLNWGWCGEKQE